VCARPSRSLIRECSVSVYAALSSLSISLPPSRARSRSLARLARSLSPLLPLPFSVSSVRPACVFLACLLATRTRTLSSSSTIARSMWHRAVPLNRALSRAYRDIRGYASRHDSRASRVPRARERKSNRARYACTVCVRRCVPTATSSWVRTPRQRSLLSLPCSFPVSLSLSLSLFLALSVSLSLSPYHLSLLQSPAPHRPRRLPFFPLSFFFPSLPSLFPSVETTVECTTTLPRPSSLLSSARVLPLSFPSLPSFAPSAFARWSWNRATSDRDPPSDPLVKCRDGDRGETA